MLFHSQMADQHNLHPDTCGAFSESFTYSVLEGSQNKQASKDSDYDSMRLISSPEGPVTF